MLSHLAHLTCQSELLFEFELAASYIQTLLPLVTPTLSWPISNSITSFSVTDRILLSMTIARTTSSIDRATVLSPILLVNRVFFGQRHQQQVRRG